jgi:hypothetical protein
MVAEVRLGEEQVGALREAVLAALDRRQRLAALALDLGLGESASAKKSNAGAKLALGVSSVSPKLLRPEKPSTSAARPSVARAKSAAERCSVPRSHIDAKNAESPALVESSASWPPRNAARTATTGTSRRGTTHSRAPLGSS